MTRLFLDTHQLDTHLFLDTHQLDTHQLDTHPETDTHQLDSHPAARRSRGFVLIVTLWTLAAMAVFAAYIDGVASADLERAAAAKVGLERELARRSTEATLAYLMSTGRMNHRGLMLEAEQSFTDGDGTRGPDRSVGVIGVAGQAYVGVGGTRFSIQDENGLVPVNFPRARRFSAALAYVGVAPADIDRIVPRVEDYVDMDDELSLSGAELFDYDSADSATPFDSAGHDADTTGGASDRDPDVPPDQDSARTWPPPGTQGALRFPNPSNWTMASPLELRRVLGVDDLIAPHQWRRLMPMLTMRQTGGYNFNTMRPDVLAATLELDQQAVDNILAERAQRSLVRLNRVYMLTGTHVDIEGAEVERTPSRYLRISIWHNASGLRSVAGMELTPFSDDAPWRIDYRYTEQMAPAPTGAEPTGAHRDPTEPAIDNESSDAGVLQAATPLLQ